MRYIYVCIEYFKILYIIIYLTFFRVSENEENIGTFSRKAIVYVSKVIIVLYS